MGVYRALLSFVDDHRCCGTDAVAVGALTQPCASGYRLGAKCGSCGELFSKWVSAEDAREDLVFTDLLTRPN
jgi:hypothetical protein